MSSTITDPEVLAFIDRTNAFYPPDAVKLSIADQRSHYDRMCRDFRRPRPAGLAVEGGGLQGAGRLIPIRRYWPTEPGQSRVVYFHGGGFVVGGLESHDDVCAEIADTCGLEVVAVDYRLCPEHPHPAAYDDALAAVDHLADRPLIVAGDSAGGNLAAAVSLVRQNKISGQVLIYPGLGGEAKHLPSYSDRAEAPLLSTQDVRYYGRIRAAGRNVSEDPTFAPLRAKSFRGLPPCFISAAEHDPLRDDGDDYVAQLSKAGVPAELLIEPELPHGHLRARSMSTRAAEAFARVCKAITDFDTRGLSLGG
ncbi:MAG: alpha/beta hydrolase [Pseudomonadota bacterium]